MAVRPARRGEEGLRPRRLLPLQPQGQAREVKGEISVMGAEPGLRPFESSNPVLARQRYRRQDGQKTAARDPMAEVPSGGERPAAADEARRVPRSGTRPSPGLVGDPMTTNAVTARTASTLAVAALAAVLTWTVPPVDPARSGPSYALAAGIGLGTVLLVVLQCRGRPSSALPAFVFAGFEAAFLGVLSNTASAHLAPGVFVQLVLGTMAAYAGVVAAYRLHLVRMARRARGYALATLLGALLFWNGGSAADRAHRHRRTRSPRQWSRAPDQGSSASASASALARPQSSLSPFSAVVASPWPAAPDEAMRSNETGRRTTAFSAARLRSSAAVMWFHRTAAMEAFCEGGPRRRTGPDGGRAGRRRPGLR
ncbi:Bax inhibitor-1/YccA family protein [Streptomyces sp. 62]|uniref:Bax inhibitor-1/YccA family membrane protein n=1 Tax=Streptomyces sp. NPDC012756 TaxID=3364847 RepID=UPI000E252FCE